MSNFHQASNFVIENLSQTDVRVDIEQQKQKAFALLLGEIVQGASHNSGERYDAPKCHPDTRKAVLDHIKSWADNNDEPARIMWLNGPAGAGKSAISQTIAEDSHRERKLIASFFFSRFVSGRNTKNGLVATIAYQLTVSIPEIKEHIVNAIATNPNIFRENIKSQFEALVVEPYRHLYHTEDSTTGPKLIIIDGLDECNDGDHQAEIIHALGSSLSTAPSRLRIIIASRPEPRIRLTFDDEFINTICTPLTLDEKYNPDKDIELFLRSSLQSLKRHHVLASMLQSWPPESSIETIVQKSSGQFIYAATVVKYVSDSQQNPRKRLDIVLNIVPAGDEKPLAQLDALYTAILSSIGRDYKKVSSIFEAIMFLQTDSDSRVKFYRNVLLDASFLDEFLSFENEIFLFLADLSFIINTNEMKVGGIRFFHASFSDYLQDSSRSQRFYIDERQAHVHLAMYCINRISSPGGSEIVSSYSIMRLAEHYMFSDWDDTILESILSNDLLAVDGVMLSHERWFYFMFPSTDTFLGSFIYKILHATPIEKVKSSLRDAINSAFLNHLQKYKPHDILTICKFMKAAGYEYRMPAELYILVPALNEDTTKQNVFFDMRHDRVRDWFMQLIPHNEHLLHFSQDAHIKSAYYILEILVDAALKHDCHIRSEARSASFHLFSPYKLKEDIIPVSFLKLASDLFDNLPDTNDVSTAIFQKWKSIEPTSEQLEKASDEEKFRYKMLDTMIQAYFKRTLKHDSQGIQTDTNENVSTAAEKFTNDIPATGNSTYTMKLLILLLSAQFLLIAYMYMHFTSSYVSCSAN